MSDLPILVPLSQPDISELEKQYVNDVLDSPRLALGPFLEQFEHQMAAACQTEHAVAVSSGTAALHLVVAALGLGPGDEVITTPFSFVASANVILYTGARIRFVDVDPETYNIDIASVESALTPRTRAILAVDVFGRPAAWPALTELAQRHGLHLIDDACEALGACVDGRRLGGWGDAAAFGFYPNKQITTGEGGCITTDSAELAMLLRSLRNQGRKSDDAMTHVRLGYNYRMNELAAALGCAQLERLDDLLDRRAAVAAAYAEVLGDLDEELVLPQSTYTNGHSPTTKRSWFVYVVQLAAHHPPEHRDALLRHLDDHGVGCAPYLPAIHLQPYYRERFGYAPGDFPVCEHASERTVALPFYGAMSARDVEYVAGVVRMGLDALREPSTVYLTG